MIVVLNTAVSRCEVSDGSAHRCRYGDPVGTGRTWYHCISKLECSNDAGRTQTYSLVVRNEGRTIGGDLQTGGRDLKWCAAATNIADKTCACLSCHECKPRP